MKREAHPNTHIGADGFLPSACEPTDARSVYALGPGETLETESFACSEDRNTFAACVRVLLPKPKLGDVRRLLVAWLPNIDLVVMFLLKLAMVLRQPLQNLQQREPDRTALTPGTIFLFALSAGLPTRFGRLRES